MTSVDVKNLKGEVVGSFDLDDRVFGIEPNQAVVHQAVVAQLANQRKGTHDTKTRGEVRGGTHKMWRQKGTGRARQGDRRAPHWTCGGVVFGPHPRSYHKDFPRKMRRLAMKSALSARVAESALTVLDDLALAAPKTREVSGLLAALGLTRGALSCERGLTQNTAGRRTASRRPVAAQSHPGEPPRRLPTSSLARRSHGAGGCAHAHAAARVTVCSDRRQAPAEPRTKGEAWRSPPRRT